MKLAEALRIRADLSRRMAQLFQRIENNCTVQEGDDPAEDPNELIKEYEMISAELTKLVIQINLTNVSTTFKFSGHPEPLPLAQALAEREALKEKIKLYKMVVNNGSIKRNNYSRSEIKFTSTVNVKNNQRTVDGLSQKLRNLDIEIQQQNWTIDIVEQNVEL